MSKQKLNKKESETALQNFLRNVTKVINQDEYDIEAEKQNLYRDYGVTESEYQGYVNKAKAIYEEETQNEL